MRRQSDATKSVVESASALAGGSQSLSVYIKDALQLLVTGRRGRDSVAHGRARVLKKLTGVLELLDPGKLVLEILQLRAGYWLPRLEEHMGFQKSYTQIGYLSGTVNSDWEMFFWATLQRNIRLHTPTLRSFSAVSSSTQNFAFSHTDARTKHAV